jgi:membrane fusion protein, heavy metal efflux system
MGRRSIWAIIVVAALGLALAVLFVVMPTIRRGAGPNAAPAAEPTPQPLPSGFFQLTDLDWSGLRFARVDAIPFPSVAETDGTIAPADDTTTQVVSPYTGRVTAVYATVGDTVRKGTPLFALDGSEYAQAVNDLASAIETLQTARVQLRVTAANRTRLLALQKTGGAATKDVEQSAADLSTAQTNVRNGETAVALVRSRLRILGLSDAAMDALAAAGRRPLLPTAVVVRAPIDGVVMQRGVGIGQNVDSAANGSTNPLFTISDLSRVFFVANVTETQIVGVHVGDPVSVRMLAFPGRTFDARVRYIAPAVDPTTHRVFVRSEVSNPSGSLRPGMFGEMRITTGPPSRILAVPEDAIIYEEDTARVWITGPDKTLALRYIKTGKTVDGTVEVLGGLSPGDHVVTSGVVFIDRALRGDE